MKLEEEEKIVREKVQALKIGTVFNNYKDMCEQLGIKVKSGKSKNAQIEMIETFLKMEKDKYKYKVIDINKNPPVYFDKRGAHNKIYSNFIEILLLQMLSEKENNTLESTRNNLYNALNMVNDNYLDYYKNPTKHQSNLQGVATFDIEKFYQTANIKLYSILDSALKSLHRKFLILYSKSTVLVTKVYNEDKTSYTQINRVCTEDEEKIVLKLKRETLLEMGYKDSWQLSPQSYKVFSKKLNEKLHEEFDCTYGYAQLRIMYNKEHVKEAIPMEEIELNKKLLNEATKAGILKSSLTEFDKLQEKEKNMLMTPEMKQELILKLDNDKEEFKELQQMLINYFINS